MNRPMKSRDVEASPMPSARDGAAPKPWDQAELADDLEEDLSLPDSGEIVQHPDGWYWLGADGRQQFGPYASFDEAQAEMHAASDDGLDLDESITEAEQDIGIADWLDPDTGEPAEGTHTRIEDH